MKKLALTFTLFSLLQIGFAQKRDIPATDHFVISGRVKDSLVVTIGDLKELPATQLGNIPITNHHGEFRSEMKDVEGVSLKAILSKVEIPSESPRELSEYYFVLIASDGYKVVYSWNEIFNTSVGDSIFVLTKMDGMGLEAMQNRISTLATTDFRTGRRYTKGLARIEVRRVE